MILPQPDLINRYNAYALVVVAAKRAKYLQERLRADQGHTPINTDASAVEHHRQDVPLRSVIKTDSRNPLTVALEEIAAGRVIPSLERKWPDEPVALPQQPDILQTAFQERLAAGPESVEPSADDFDRIHASEEADESGDSLVSYDETLPPSAVAGVPLHDLHPSADETDADADYDADAAARDAAADMERIELDPVEHAARLASLDQMIRGALTAEDEDSDALSLAPADIPSDFEDEVEETAADDDLPLDVS